ncbi:uncharacterized protein LOC142552644 isoform X3 [Primulina tabacum]|uniref:uncharacterized protein LOC142552644 isoform X3 n=1 Tax=Primulina tabacum TaxID=48773 RepID=UPI003F591D98
MGKDEVWEKSDDIEIIAIGNMYTGSWDKKYWSSSRGKDRYPYPVGYKSIRNLNGITFKMEILQGPKGPSFTISSTDGKSCSGETPVIAWESFQRGCYRTKLGHGKRFSCKIDGAEFFGFKNAFVQRLLRELVANVSGTAEQGLLISSISSRDCEAVYQLNDKGSVENHDLVPYLVKSHFTRKRSRTDKVVNDKRVNQTHVEQNQCKKYRQEANASNSRQTDKLTRSGSKCATTNEISGFCASTEILGEQKLAKMIENETCPSTAEKVARLDSVVMPEYLTVENSLSLCERELICSRNNLECGTDKVLKNHHPKDGPRIADIQEFNDSTPEETDGGTNVHHSMTIIKDVDICAPDTLDHVGDNSSVSSSINHEQFPWNVKEEMINNVVKSEVLITDSVPEEEIRTSTWYSSSEKCDTDSVGEDIAKSMMTVLLPRALPLLKTFTRKKKKSVKPLEIAPLRLQDKNGVSNACTDDAAIAREPTRHSNTERQKEKAHVPRICNDLVVSTFGNTETMVPDTFDNVDCQDVLPDLTKASQLLNVLDTQSQLQANREANVPICHDGINEPTRTSDVMLVATTDAILAPRLEITASPRSDSAVCHTTDKLHAIQAATMKQTPESESTICKSLSDVDPPKIPTTGCYCSEVETNQMEDLNIQLDVNEKLPGLLEFFACYIQPMPISMVQLIVKGNDIYVCVKCGSLERKESTLFVYKAVKKGKKLGCPFFIGHVPIAFQLSRNPLGGDVGLESSLLQFIPDTQALVLLNSIRTPYCRDGKLNCLCAACTSDCVEENAVKIVQLNSGYVSLLARLETTHDVCCLLVCEPSFLLAAEEGGKLKLWLMNSTWSAQRENWYLPTFNCMFPCLVELKRIPNSAVLVVGHNGFGEFGIWDIVKRNMVSKFSSPGTSIIKCVPAGIFKWQRKSESTTEEIIDKIMYATKQSFSETIRIENHVSSTEDKDVAVWLLISIVNRDSQHCQSSAGHANLLGEWRLALLINNTVIIGSAISQGAAAVTSSGHGIIGSRDGLVYEWELSTGTKLGTLHSFKGAPVSCIATDETNSGALAIASGCQLLVYLQS